MKQALLPIAVSLCAACGSMDKAGPTTPAKVFATGDIVFELGEVTVFDGKDAVLKVHRDGSTEMGYHHGENIKIEPGVPFSTKNLPIVLKPGPKIAADGRFLDDKGAAKVRANFDGSFVTLADGKAVPGLTVANDTIRIEYGGSVVTWTLAADGTLAQHGGNIMSDGPVRIIGADTPGKRRAILSLVAVMRYPHKLRAEPVEPHPSGPVIPVEDVKEIQR